MQTARKMISVDPAESGSDVVLFPSSPKHESLVGAYLAFAAICIIWGTTFVAIRVVIETIPTLLVTGIRFSIAAVLLLGIAVISKAKFPRSTAEWWHQALAGIVMAGVGNALVVFAERASRWRCAAVST